MNIKKYLPFFLIVFLFACDSFKKVKESTDYEYKYEMAKKYYDRKDYEHASDLFKELMQVFRGTQRSEQIFYYWVYCDFHMEDYLFAAHQFQRFILAFPRSQYAEELQYMIGVCYMKYSPDYYLDQEYTIKSIDEFQLFLDKYPNSSYVEKVNENIDLLQGKLERKGFESVSLYYKIGEYKACIVTGEGFASDYPDSKYVEQVKFMMVESAYKYAIESVEEKQMDRLNEVGVLADKYLVKFGDSKKAEDIIDLKAKSKQKLKESKYQLPFYYFNRGDYTKAKSVFSELLLNNEFSDKKAELIYYQIKSSYLYAQTVEPDKKIGEYQNFKNLFDSYRDNESLINSNYYKELQNNYKSAEENCKQIPSLMGKEYADMANYEKASKYYFEYANKLSNINEKHKNLVNGIDAAYKDAERSDVFNQYSKFQHVSHLCDQYFLELSADKYGAVSAAIRVRAEEEQSKFPLKIFEYQASKKQYSWIKENAPKYLDERKMGEFQDEIVYLWAISEYQLAKKSEKYERKKQYQQALERLMEMEKLSFKKVEYLNKISKLEAEINAKIEKLTK